MNPNLKKRIGRILALTFILPGGAFLLVAFFLGNYTRWQTSRGPVATAIVLSKTDELPRKGFVHTYRVQLAFGVPAIDSVTTETEVSHANFLALNVRDRVAVNYDRQNPQQVLLTSEYWFDWQSLSILPLGLALIWAAVQALRTKRML